MRQTTGNLTPENIYHGINPNNEFFIPKKNKVRYGQCLLKCCATFGIIMGLNMISFYVGYIVAQDDSSESL
tara:strand:- start:304 stop:516 length:213 start_codon:yes stop_codon:yes gene_type:complete